MTLGASLRIHMSESSTLRYLPSERLGALVIPRVIPRVRHLRGMPPVATGDVDQREAFPRAEVVIITALPEGCFLDRYSRDGEKAGNTWHPTVDEARAQAEWEFDGALSDWIVIPSASREPVIHVLRHFPKTIG